MKVLWNSIMYGWRRLTSRPIYLIMMTVVPLVVCFFFVDLMKEGLPLETPTAVVDLDHSSLSRQTTRALDASELVHIDHKLESYHEALEKVRSGEIFGFFLIPRDFERDAIGGTQPTLSYYSNMTYYVPGTLTFKGFKTIAVTVTGGIVVTTLSSIGLGEDEAMSLINPVSINDHPLGNPWLNYSYYLNNSFIVGVLALLVMMITVFSICDEIKSGTSPLWLDRSGGSIVVALFGKLAPQTVIFTAVGFLIQAVMFGYLDYPLHNHVGHMMLAMFLMVAACQGFALCVCELIPNLRFALSIVSLLGILTFSIAAISFPVESMYGAVGIFSYILPFRYYFLIYADQALNGLPIFYSRWYYIALLAFLVLPLLGLYKLKKHLLRPVYIP